MESFRDRMTPSIQRVSRAILASLVALATGLEAQEPLNLGTPESVGLSTERLTLVTRALERRVENGDIAGAVAGIVRHGKLIYLEAIGYRDLASESPMRDDALFRMYSMTRPIVSLGAMLLWEEGKFRLDDPVADYIPAFQSQRVFLDADAPNMVETRERTNPMLVEHLLLHTSGLGSRSSSIYRAENVRSRSISLEEMVTNAARVPLFEEPGTRWRYGISTSVLGRLVEIWSGQPLDAFLTERVFEPLGMNDTVFWADPGRAPRLATVYRPDVDGSLRPIQLEDVPFTERPRLLEGGVGLVSSTRDFLRFSQMFLDGGRLGERRLAKPETIALMIENRVPPALLPIGFGRPMHGAGWTLGFCVAMDGSRYDHPMSNGTYWWDGSAGTRFWIDPALQMVTIVNAQVSPASGNGFREEFKRLVHDAVLEP